MDKQNVLWNTILLAATVRKAIFSIKVTVKVTRSLSFVSFGSASLVCMLNMKSLSFTIQKEYQSQQQTHRTKTICLQSFELVVWKFHYVYTLYVCAGLIVQKRVWQSRTLAQAFCAQACGSCLGIFLELCKYRHHCLNPWTYYYLSGHAQILIQTGWKGGWYDWYYLVIIELGWNKLTMP